MVYFTNSCAIAVPVSCRRQLYDLSNDMVTKVDIHLSG